MLSVKQVWRADYPSGEGTLWDLHEWYNLIVSQGNKSGYYVNEKKCWLILSAQHGGRSEKNICKNCSKHIG